VAAARAAETARPDALIRDEFAYLLTSSAGPAWAQMASSDTDWLGDDEDGRRMHEMARDYQAVRTHYFDAYFAAAVRTGIRQVVILAAGLDSRAYRLDWPAGTTVFEIDQPKVLGYKTSTLDAHGAVPTSQRVPVPVDLRDDWPAALIAAGFDPTQPTAWLAEGLLPYLPADAQDRLFSLVTEHSATGSQIAVEAFHLDPEQYSDEKRAARRERTAHLRDRLGLDLDVDTLMYTDDVRADAADWLADHGWLVDSVSSTEEMARLGRGSSQELVEQAIDSVFVHARIEGGGR
jgi:methyltransferase (TIGR00027 family)